MEGSRPLDDRAFRALAEKYLDVKEIVLRAGYGDEIDWQDEIRPDEIAESDFLRESAWVILSCGFAERSVKARFRAVSAAFKNWSSAGEIVKSRDDCRDLAFSAFRNAAKIDGIVRLVEYVSAHGFADTKSQCYLDPVGFLSQFPYFGQATSRHLAKNLGLSTSKPDRHLKRAARAAGYDCPEQMCTDLANGLEESVSVVDIVIWRHAVLFADYERLWSRNSSSRSPLT